MSRIRRANDDEIRATPGAERLKMKADQEWDMAGYARQDGDSKAEAEHTEKAREYERQLADLLK